jgi:hypothetical protein
VGNALIWNGLIYPCVTTVGKKRASFEDSKTAYYRFSHAWITRKVFVSTVNEEKKKNKSEAAKQEEEQAAAAKKREKLKRKEEKKKQKKEEKAKKMNQKKLTKDGGDDDEEDIDEEEFLRQVIDSNSETSSDEDDATNKSNKHQGNKVGNDDDDDDQVVYEEALKPANIVALGKKMRLVPGLVKDREDISIASSALSVITGLYENEQANNSEDNSGGVGGIDVEVAFPLTFFGCDAISWMV